jgi:uroporphyrinogen decarboxylase
MGMEVVMVDKKGPHFPDPLNTPDDKQYKEVMERKVDVKKELGYVYDAITLTRKKLAGRVPLIGFCGAPWTLLCYMVEGGGTKLFIKSKSWVFKYTEESKALLQKISELCVEYLALQVQAGAQVRRPLIWMDSADRDRCFKSSTHGPASCLPLRSRHTRCRTSHTSATTSQNG